MSVAPESTLEAIAATAGALVSNHGIEREALRVDPQGNLSRAPHPWFLGSKLTHPSITTDFSEAQLELITPKRSSVKEMMDLLTEIHQVVHAGLGDEVMWSASMPCVLSGDNHIPLANYGTSNLGRLKTTYRNGLGYRYGRAMQTICAVHYNFSFSDTFWSALAEQEYANDDKAWRSKRYFDLMRNFRRLSWLPVYLFGASPSVCNSFVRGRNHDLERFDEGSLYAKGATSLRCGNLGYQSDTQRSSIRVCYNSLENYVSTLAEAICTPWPAYEEIGVLKGDEYRQVNTSILQSEAEFYTTIRAKCVPPKGANFLKVLLGGGVEYVEIRLLDVNPFAPLGIDADTIHFLEVLLLHCLLSTSSRMEDEECDASTANVQQVVYGGREPETMLDDRGTARGVKEWGLDIIRAMEPLAHTMDKAQGTTLFTRTLDSQRDKLVDAELTPSAQVLNDMKSQSVPFFRFAMNKAIAHQQYFRNLPMSTERQQYYRDLAEQSRMDQKKIEAGDVLPFDKYLERLNREYRDLIN